MLNDTPPVHEPRTLRLIPSVARYIKLYHRHNTSHSSDTVAFCLAPPEEETAVRLHLISLKPFIIDVHTMPQGQKITSSEVAKHALAEDCWIVVNGKVYDLTKFAPNHPGGAESEWKSDS